MNTRVEKIISELKMYERVENIGRFIKMHNTVVHELHIELDGDYNTLESQDIKEDIKEFKNYLSTSADEEDKEILEEIILYLKKKIL